MPEYEDERLVGKERAQWEKGYIKAYAEYVGSGVTLHPGEYFKVLRDDGKNNLYVEKESGENGWINIDYKNPARYELNELFFFLAG